ncbi:MAG: hypothetical protein AcusKO_24480 [Acuticoccus sp.]
MQAGTPSPSPAAPASPADAWATVLLVEDDRSALLVMQEQVTGLGYNVLTATNGAEAFALLRETPGCADVVMTDRMMPVLDGLGLTRRLKRERATKHIPVVVLTGAKDPADVSSGIEAGAFYYLTKPSTGELIASVLGAAMQEVARHKKVREDLDSHQTAFRNMEVVRFRLRRPDEVDSVVSMLASMHDAPDRIIQGIYELVQNAVEHGVLRFGLEDKGRLLDEGRWEAALAERIADPAYAEGWAEATAIRREDGIYINIKDNGPGFNWRPYLKTDPSRAGALCGRGIARAANFAFDKLHYDETGNQAVAFIARSPRVKW